MPAPVTTRKRKGAWEEELCPICGHRRREREESTFLGLAPPPLPLPLPLPLPTRFSRSSRSSTATSPTTHDLTAAYAAGHLSRAFGPLSLSPSPASASPRPGSALPQDFVLQVTAQAIPLPAPICDPPLLLRLCFVRRWVERRPSPPSLQKVEYSATTPSPAEEEGLEEVSRSSAGFAALVQSSAGRFFSADTALADVRRLLASAPGCDDAPWSAMPVARFTAEASAMIRRFISGRRTVGSLGPDRFVCHLEITARCDQSA